MAEIPDVSGTAALAICESPLLALNDRRILPEKENIAILQDAASAHSNDWDVDGKAELHNAVADLINGILAGGNSMRRRWRRTQPAKKPVEKSCLAGVDWSVLASLPDRRCVLLGARACFYDIWMRRGCLHGALSCGALSLPERSHHEMGSD